MWVMPSSSARCAQLPRAADKVPFYTALKKFRDYLNGLITEIDENEMVFTEPRVKSFYEAEPKPEPFSPDLTDISNAVIHNDESSAIPYKKKRGRPKKSKVEGEEPTPKPVVRKPPQPTEPNDNGNFPKKKRGRPKKIKVGAVDQVKIENNTSASVSHCYSNLSPMRSLNGFYQMGPTGTTPNGNTNNMYPSQPQPYSQSPRPPFCQSPRSVYNDPMRPTYSSSPKPQYSQSPKMESQSPRPNYSQSPRPPYSQSPRPPYSQSPRPPYSQSPRPTYSQSPRPSYSQSPRPHSQPFTHSDLSSEISAAISSEQLASPIGPPDFEPLTNMDDEAECRLESPSPSTNSEHSHYYHQSYNMDPPHTQQNEQQQYSSPRPTQDIASKSLSGLESLVDQIPSLTEGEGLLNEPEHYTSQFSNYNPSSSRGSPVPYNCPPSTTGYPIYPTPTWSSHYEPIPFGYPQLPYGQGYGPGLHVPGPDYPYYSYSQPTPSHPPGYPSYLGGF